MKLEDLLTELNSLDPEKRTNIIINLYEEEKRYLIYDDNYWFYVYQEPLGNPSFHLFNKPKNIHTVFQLKDFKILEKKSKNQYSNKEIKEIKEWLKEKDEFGTKRIFILLNAWNVVNPNYKINQNYIEWR